MLAVCYLGYFREKNVFLRVLLNVAEKDGLDEENRLGRLFSKILPMEGKSSWARERFAAGNSVPLYPDLVKNLIHGTDWTRCKRTKGSRSPRCRLFEIRLAPTASFCYSYQWIGRRDRLATDEITKKRDP